MLTSTKSGLSHTEHLDGKKLGLSFKIKICKLLFTHLDLFASICSRIELLQKQHFSIIYNTPLNQCFIFITFLIVPN